MTMTKRERHDAHNRNIKKHMREMQARMKPADELNPLDISILMAHMHGDGTYFTREELPPLEPMVAYVDGKKVMV